MKKRASFEKQLEDFAARANDELELLGDLGPAHFDSSELLDLKRRLDERILAFDRSHQRIVWAGASAAGWLLLGAVCLAIGWAGIGRALLFMAPVSVAIFLSGAAWLRKKFRTKGHWLALRDAVLDELLLRSERPKKGAN